MTNLTDKQKALLDELFKDFKGDAKELLGENRTGHPHHMSELKLDQRHTLLEASAKLIHE